MKIKILECLEGAAQAEGLAVIIDVFRAYSLEAYLFDRQVKEIYAVGSEETARRLGREHPDWIMIGERKGKILPGFHYGNSPSQTQNVDMAGRTVIHTTSAGTQGMVVSRGASEKVTGSLVNARAVAEYIRKRDPETVSLVAMGYGGTVSAPEDLLAARYIRGILTGEELDMEAELAKLRRSPTVERFFLPEMQEIFPAPDYELCTKVDCLSMVLAAEQTEEEVFRIRRVV